MHDYSNIQQSTFSYLAYEMTITGRVVVKGPCRISATIDGEIQSLDKGLIVLEMKGKIIGNIRCADIEIYGTVQGDIHSTGKVILYSTAKLHGKLQAQSIVIHPGAFIEMTGHTQEA
jgi:cytoskeletal protein CcmA (bactofilin family)